MANELQRLRDAVGAEADRLDREYDFLAGQVEEIEQSDRPHPEAVALATAQAKRTRSMANGLVRSLAQLRDHLQPKEGTR